MLISKPAWALTLAAPAGGGAFWLPAKHILCDSNANLQGWHIDVVGSRTKFKPPAEGPQLSLGQVSIKTAPTQAACGMSPQTVILQAVAAWPSVQPDSVVVNVDVGRVDVVGVDLKGASLYWRLGDHEGLDTCSDPQVADGRESCAFSIERGLSSDPSLMRLVVLPPGLHNQDDLMAFADDGHKLGVGRYTFAAAKIVLVDLISPEATLDAALDEGRIALRHPEAIDHVTCRGATCELVGRELLVRGVRALDESLEVRPTLRPHVFVQGASQLLGSPILSVPLQHCPMQLASAAPLRGAPGQKIVMAVGGRCKDDNALRFFIGGSAAQLTATAQDADKLYVVLHSHVSMGDETTVVVQRQNVVAGMARVVSRAAPMIRSQVHLDGYGAIDFIPSNRTAEVMLPTLSDGGSLVPIAVPGVYTVVKGSAGGYHIQGSGGAMGWTTLRIAYRDGSLPTALKETNLTELSDSVERSIHPASIPMTLGASALGATPIIEMQCTDAKAQVHRITPAHPTNISYQQKDSCRLVLHRERLSPEDGDQLVRVTVSVAASDGTNRPEAAIDQRVLLRPGLEPRFLYIGGVGAPFDRIVARVAVITEDLHESVAAIGQGERVNLAQVQWAVTVGNNRLRLYATTAMPTGLFRVADKNHSGLMGLNAGILSRLVLLTSQGMQAPIALELGVMVLGITGDSTPAPTGHVAAVMGLSLSVPIANVSRTTQAAISLHAWGEYEVSRVFRDGSGTPWGFVFGPSLSFGAVGINL